MAPSFWMATMLIVFVRCTLADHATKCSSLLQKQARRTNASNMHYFDTLDGKPPTVAVDFEILGGQMQYELRIEQDRAMSKPPVVSKIVMSLIVTPVLCCLSFCGVDRCIMGQPLLGTLKGLSCGGCFVWFIIDLVVIMYNCVMWAPSIDMLGFRATWEERSVTPAFGIALIGAMIWMVILACGRHLDAAKYKTKAAFRTWKSRSREGITARYLQVTEDELLHHYFRDIDTDTSQESYKFSPNQPMGIRCDKDGLVKDVALNGQAEQKGIRYGYMIMTVNDEAWDEIDRERQDKIMYEGCDAEYEATFIKVRTISKEKLSNMLVSMGEEQLSDDDWQKVVAKVVTNHDGELDFNEFVRWYTSSDCGSALCPQS